MKKCTKCGVEKPEINFSKQKKGAGGLTAACKDCNSKAGKLYYQNNWEKITAKNKRWWDAHPEAASAKRHKRYWNNIEDEKKRHRKFITENPEYMRTSMLKRKYGLTPKDFDRMSKEQGGVCAVCKLVPGGKGFYIDHNHETGRVRGLLCFTCNMALGLLKDSAIVARSAAEYLEKTV